jgi:CRP-like cAMP-binding protein
MAADVAMLRMFSIFKNIPEGYLERITQLCSEKIVYPGEIIFREGEPGLAIFVVMRGDIEVLFTAGEDELVCMEWVAAGDVLGVRAFFKPYKYLSSARSLTEGRLLAIDAVKLRELCEQDCWLAISIHERFMQAMLNRVISLRSQT